MKEIAVGCDLAYDVVTPTTFLFNLSVAPGSYQSIVQESFLLTPHVEMEFFSLGLAQNNVQRVRLLPCQFRLQYEARVVLQAEIDSATSLTEQPYRELPPDVLPYLNPSRFCESDLLGEFAMSEFGELPHGHSRVESICDWIHSHIRYTPDSTTAETTARDVLVQRLGVCRDFAHLAIAFCRALSIPARYVSGYAVDLNPPDFHGFFEAYLGERWYLFDATKLAPIGGLVRIATGADAADVPFATLIGSATLTGKSVWASRISGNTNVNPGQNDQAISTA